MKLRIKQFSDPGKPGKENEDVVGTTTFSAWVLDGATGLSDDPLLPGNSDAAWLVGAFNARLRAEADMGDRDLPTLFRVLIADVAAEFAANASRPPAGRFEEPSAGMAIVRLRQGNIECASLGDCKAILSVGSQMVSTLESPVLRRLDAKIVARMQEIRERDPSLDIEALLRAVRGELRENRSKLNTKGGYWVLWTEPAAADAIEVQSVPLDGAETVFGLLVSDGFYRLVDVFEAYPNDAALLAAARKRGLEALMTELRTLEDNDPQCRERMRINQETMLRHCISNMRRELSPSFLWSILSQELHACFEARTARRVVARPPLGCWERGRKQHGCDPSPTPARRSPGARGRSAHHRIRADPAAVQTAAASTLPYGPVRDRSRRPALGHHGGGSHGLPLCRRHRRHQAARGAVAGRTGHGAVPERGPDEPGFLLSSGRRRLLQW